jgi:hypothetical protein
VPGLINAHDHLHRNHYPRLGIPPYSDVHAWGADIHARYPHAITRAQRLPRRDALLFGALKNLLGGVTTVVHHDRWETDFEHEFPLRTVRLRHLHTVRDIKEEAATIRSDETPLAVHVAEGTDPSLSDEVRVLAEHDLLNDRLLAVHGVALDRAGIHLLHLARAALVWCPTSNQFLYGATAPAEVLDGRVDVLLGTDSLLSAAGTILHELHEARRLGHLDGARLEASVGTVAARRLRCPEPTLDPGNRADVVFLRRSLLEASPRDVALVVVGGRPVLGDALSAPLFEYCRVPMEELDVAGALKLVAAPMGSIAARIFAETPECARMLDITAGAATDHTTDQRRI